MQDLSEAVKWYRRAAAQGEGYAQFWLGMEAESGSCVPKDYVEAYKWYILGAAWDADIADKNREKIALLMTPKQIAEGKKRAAAFVPKKKGHEN